MGGRLRWGKLKPKRNVRNPSWKSAINQYMFGMECRVRCMWHTSRIQLVRDAKKSCQILVYFSNPCECDCEGHASHWFLDIKRNIS